MMRVPPSRGASGYTYAAFPGYRLHVDPLQMRASDVDRDAAITHLQVALEEGRLTTEEFTARTTTVFAAKTYADLRVPLSDLPIAQSDLPSPSNKSAAKTATTSTASTASAALPTRGAVRRTHTPVPLEVQRRRSLIASMVALLTIFTGAAIIATTPMTDVYADSAYGYGYGSAVVRDEFGAAIISEKAMFSEGAEYGYEILRHNGAAEVLRITAQYPDAVIRVRIDVDGDETGPLRSSSYRGVADVLLPAGSQPVEISVEGPWTYQVLPLDGEALAP